MMRRIARVVPAYAALFLILMAVLIDSPALFYMATAMIGTIGALRLQAWLAVRGLRIERINPPAVRLGDIVTVSLVVWSEKKIKRPLITIKDRLPLRHVADDITPSLPIAPAFDRPISTRYSFRAARRGIFRWSDVLVEGTDALGLVMAKQTYHTEPAELIVYPAAIPVSVDLRPGGGSGSSEAEHGKFRGPGIEPRGVREYVPGDPQRYVHWTSSARSGRLMVKEFDVGSDLSADFFIQDTEGSEMGIRAHTTLEAMVGHAKYLAEEFTKLSARVRFPSIDPEKENDRALHERLRHIDLLLTKIQANNPRQLSNELEEFLNQGGSVGSAYLFIAMADTALPTVISRHRSIEWNVLVYDASHYQPELSRAFQSANDSAFLHQIEAAGGRVVMMPNVNKDPHKELVK